MGNVSFMTPDWAKEQRYVALSKEMTGIGQQITWKEIATPFHPLWNQPRMRWIKLPGHSLCSQKNQLGRISNVEAVRWTGTKLFGSKMQFLVTLLFFGWPYNFIYSDWWTMVLSLIMPDTYADPVKKESWSPVLLVLFLILLVESDLFKIESHM